MALSIDTQDLDNWPGNIKKVTLDQSNVVLTGVEGDERFVLSFSTNAYSDNVERTAISDLYITTTNTGWCKSSGLTGSGGKFLLTALECCLKVNIDYTTNSGTGSGDGYYNIFLDYNGDGTPISGEIIAENIKTKIRALAPNLAVGDAGLELSYLNTSAEFKNGRFFVTSGSVGEYYNGTNRTSVTISVPDSLSAAEVLGFDLNINSMIIDTMTVKEAVVTSSYTTDTATLMIGPGTGFVAGDCMMITDGTNKDYFTVISGSNDTMVTVSTEAVNGYVGISNSYNSTVSKVQVLREQDPEVLPNTYHTTVDSICKHGIKSVVNQLSLIHI